MDMEFKQIKCILLLKSGGETVPKSDGEIIPKETIKSQLWWERECQTCKLYPFVLLGFENHCLSCGLKLKLEEKQLVDYSLVKQHLVQIPCDEKNDGLGDNIGAEVYTAALANQILLMYQKKSFFKWQPQVLRSILVVAGFLHGLKDPDHLFDCLERSNSIPPHMSHLWTQPLAERRRLQIG
jgi:hypothetical protein